MCINWSTERWNLILWMKTHVCKLKTYTQMNGSGFKSFCVTDGGAFLQVLFLCLKRGRGVGRPLWRSGQQERVSQSRCKIFFTSRKSCVQELFSLCVETPCNDGYLFAHFRGFSPTVYLLSILGSHLNIYRRYTTVRNPVRTRERFQTVKQSCPTAFKTFHSPHQLEVLGDSSPPVTFNNTFSTPPIWLKHTTFTKIKLLLFTKRSFLIIYKRSKLHNILRSLKTD